MTLPNMYHEIRENLYFNKFTVGELLFVEYKCPIDQESAGVWTPMDYFVHVLSGRKTWRTIEGSWTLEKGDTLFFKGDTKDMKFGAFSKRFLFCLRDLRGLRGKNSFAIWLRLFALGSSW